jgi:hypothetical protein
MTLAAVTAALVLAVSCALTWRAAVVARRRVEHLEREIARLERERATRPILRLAFEFHATTREALLHVMNDGGSASVCARMSVDGALTQRVESDLRAAWLDTAQEKVSIGRGEMRTLRVAELDLSVFPYAQWQIFALRGHEVCSVRAMNTSMIGGNPETHAPPVFLQVALVSSPQSATPPPECTIVLQPFEAVRLRAL